MSTEHMRLTVLATGLAEAVAKDERFEEDGFDLSSGLFGRHVSEWLREVNAMLSAAPAAPTGQPSEHFKVWCEAFQRAYGRYPVAQDAWLGALASSPASTGQPSDEQVAIDFYARNPSAALFDLRRRLASPVKPSPEQWAKNMAALEDEAGDAATIGAGAHLVEPSPEPSDDRCDELRQVLVAVQREFRQYGNSFPDGFDSRVFRYVDDALAPTHPEAPAAPQAEASMVDMVPPATTRDRWMYEQGRLAERDPRTHAAEAVRQPLTDALENVHGLLTGRAVGQRHIDKAIGIINDVLDSAEPAPTAPPQAGTEGKS